ncbi:response regulator [Cohnella sp. AR92]|uniref:response regulator transcription factor n=1 Tax=Cohnella sp. AR92 TaxID=648716 RepID=UPI000F8E2160|nr:response regulator [Cohnella sp. AR92]RUS49062.1 response regulator [Cohnella sp. AR92]
MLKVLIIDDEEPSREAIRILGDWQGLGIDEVFEAGNGKEGLALLEQRRPDIVLVDMKMPEMDGLEFLKHVEREYPNLFTIVISGYNDFEYTRQAIRSRVVDYLLKPLNRQDLNQALRNAVEVLEARKQTESEFIDRNITLNMSVPKLKENIYLSIIERNVKVNNNEAYLRLIGADDPDKRYCATAVRILNMESVAETRFKQETDLLRFAVTNVINDFADEGFQSFGFANPKREREIIVVHSLSNEVMGDVSFRSNHFMKKIVSALGELFGIVVAAGIGMPIREISRLSDSYESAAKAAESIDLLKLPGDRGIVSDVSNEGPKENVSLLSRFSQLRTAIDAGNLNQVRGVVQDYAKMLRTLPLLRLKDADRVLKELVRQLDELLLENGGTPEPHVTEGSLKELGIVADYAGAEQFEALLVRIAEVYFHRIRSSAAADKSFAISEIKEFIDQNYFEDIKVSMFTEKYFLSREYLMKLFKQQYGFGIHEYVQKIRMDKAKELLSHSELKIQEISEMLGYKDKNYFSKAFRNYFSLSPTEYRMKQSDG